MIPFKAEQTIDRPADDVWAYAADMARHARWMNVLEVRSVDGAPTVVGTRAVERIRFGPREVDVELEVAESIPAKRISWRTTGRGPMKAVATLDLDAIEPDRTRAVWSGSIGLTGLWRLLEPMMAGEVRAGEDAELRRLKEQLESDAATGSTAAS